MNDRDEEIREVLRKQLLEINVEFTAKGHKSSEGDGRTAADIKQEIEEQNGS